MHAGNDIKITITEEVHAELCYAESLLLKSMLTFVEDETLVSFVKAGLKIRTCFLSYKYIAQLAFDMLNTIFNILLYINR